MGNLHIEITGDNTNFVKALKEAKVQVYEMSNAVKQEGEAMGDVFGKVGKLAAGMFAGASIKGFVDKLVEVRGMFQDIESSMATFLGSAEEASKFVDELNDYAWYNMFEFEDLAKQSAQLLAFGNDVNDVIPILDKLSNIAAGTKVPLEEMVGLYNRAKNIGSVDSKGMQSWAAKGIVINDVLKEMGAKTKATSVTFEELNDVLNHVTGEGGMFYNLMGAQLDNLSASTGQLADDITNMYNEIGKATQDYLKIGIDFADTLVANYENLGKAVASLIATYGAYRACLILNQSIEAVRILGMADSIKYLNLLTKSTKAYTVAQTIANTVAKANPYVLLATALIGAATAFAMYHKNLNAAEQENERALKTEEEMANALQERKDSIERLLSTLEDENASEFQHWMALNDLKRLMPEVFEKYRTEKELIEDLTSARKEYNLAIEGEATAKQKVSYEESVERAEELRKLARIYGKAVDESKQAEKTALKVKYKEELGDARKTMNVSKYLNELADQAAANAESQRQKIAQAETASAQSRFASMSVNELRQYISEMEEYEKGAEAMTDKMIYIGTEGFQTSAQEIRERISAANEALINATEKADLDYIAEAKKSYYKALDDKEAVIASRLDKTLYPTEEAYIKALEKADADIDSAKKYLESLGGNTKDTTAKELADYQAQVKLAEKDKIRMIQDSELNVRQEQINIMEDSVEKEMLQLKVNYDKEKLAISRYYEDLRQSKVDAARKMWYADPNNKKAIERGGVFNEASVDTSLTSQELSEMYAKIQANEHTFRNAVENTQRRELQFMLDYLKEYGTFQQRKLALTQEYDRKIADSHNEYERKSLERQKQNAIGGVEADALSASINWANVFGDLSGVVRSEMERNLSALRELMNSDKFRSMDATSQSKIVEAVDSIRDSLGGSFSGLSIKNLGNMMTRYQDSMKSLNDALKQEEEAYARLAVAQDGYAEAMENGTIEEKASASATLTFAQAVADNATQAVMEFQDDVSATGATLSDGMKQLVSGINGVASGLSGLTSGSLQGAFNGIQKLTSTLSSLDALKDTGFGNALKGIADKMGGVIGTLVGAVLGVLDVIKDGLGKLFSDLIDLVGNAINGVVKNIISGEFIVQIGGAIKDLLGNWLNTITFGGFGSWIGAKGNSKEVNRITEELTMSNKHLQTSIDALTREMGKAAGADTVRAYEQAIEAQKEYTENLRKINEAQQGYHKSHHSNSYYIDQALSDADWEQISARLGVKVISAAGLWALSPEDLSKVASLTGIWDKIMSASAYDKDEYLSQYLDQVGKLEEIDNKFKTAMTQTTFDGMYDSFVDKLMDMESATEDFTDDISRMFQKAMVANTVGKQYEQRLQDWYDDFAESMKSGGLDDNEMRSLRETYEALVQSAIADRDAIAQATGYGSAFSQSATSGGFSVMSETQADELSGRFTALQVAGESVNQNVLAILSHMQTLAEASSSSGGAVSEIRDMMVIANSYLEDIAKYTKIASGFKDQIDRIAENTKRL